MAIVSAAVLLAACGSGKDDKKAPGQTVAKVNKEELTVHQINFLLSQQRGLRPEQADAASRQILERLIDQELAVQKALDQKLDRDARVVAQLEAARREVLSRAYFDRVGDAAPKPTADDVKKYYDANPALFAERRIYQLQEVAIEAPADKAAALKDVLANARSFGDFLNHLRSNAFKFSGNQVVRGAEQIPMSLLGTLSKMKDGETLFNTTPNGAAVLLLVNSRQQPVDEASARVAIEQFLSNDRKRKLIAEDMKALRTGATIQYLGKFAEGARPAAAPAAPVPTAADVAASAAGTKSGFGLKDEGAAPAPVASAPSAQGPAAAAAPAAAPAPAPAASTLDASTITKGLGLK